MHALMVAGALFVVFGTTPEPVDAPVSILHFCCKIFVSVTFWPVYILILYEGANVD